MLAAALRSSVRQRLSMRDEEEYLTDMVASARMAQQFISGKSKDEFLGDVILQEAVLRRLGIIGEAASRITSETRGEIPQLPWKDIIAMRDILIHVYFGVDLNIAWDAATKDLQ